MKPGRQARVLVVDDEARNRDFLEQALVRFGNEVVLAEDGQEALAEVKRQRPDLVLLDIAMPRMNGLDVCRALKSDPTTRLIPVVLLTALGDRETRIAGLEAGADDFFDKPFDLWELTTRIRALLNLKGFTDKLVNSLAVAVRGGESR
ncbi:MAG: response regulator [Candidatus Methylomirabilia bacterium]